MGLLISKAFIPPEGLLGCVMNMTGVEVGEEGVVSCMTPWEDCVSYDECDGLWGFLQVMGLIIIYGYILFYASNMLSNGSELLLLVPSVAGIVGSVVLPILGAVPDGAIMLFSGLGPDAQNQLTVGIGTIAGSTIMLLTIPWGLSIILGKVPLDRDGAAIYGSKQRKRASAAKPNMFTGYGVTPESSIRSNAIIMVATSLIYLIIQGPAFEFARDDPAESAGLIPHVAKEEHNYALVGLILACVAFVAYILIMMHQSDGSGTNQEYLITTAMIKAIDDEASAISLAGVLAPIIKASASKATAQGGLAMFSGALLDAPGKQRLGALLKPFFKRYDANNDGAISTSELRDLLRQLGEECSTEEAANWMSKLDPDQSGSIGTAEFTDAMLNYISEKARLQAYPESPAPCKPGSSGFGQQLETATAGDEEDEEDADEEMPEDLHGLSPEKQQTLIKRRAAVMMTVGLALILIFSDPMVGVMSNVGARLGVPPFYVSFILAPLASNASELIASLNYAGKKTRKTITVSLAALEGAACMNNTFCLAIFMALVYFKGLAWKFSAETLSILIVELLVACLALQRTQTVSHAFFALSLFPASLLFVALLEASGYD